MHRRINKKRRGFTLVEVLVALFSVLVLTAIFAACIPMSMKTSIVNSQYSQAISLCQHKIDQLRAVGYGRLVYVELRDAEIIDTTKTSQPFVFNRIDDVSDYLIDPTTSLRIQEVDTDTSKITVTITWKVTKFSAKTSSASLAALITNVE